MKFIIYRLTTSLLIFVSCSLFAQIPKLYSHVPSNVSLVIDINNESLSKKASFKDLGMGKLMDSLLKKSDSLTRKLLKDPSETGIDFKNHLIMAMEAGDNTEDDPKQVNIYGKILDQNKLADLVSKTISKDLTYTKSGSIHMVIDNDMLLCWNSELFVITIQTELFKKTGNGKSQLRNKERKKLVSAAEKNSIALLTTKPNNFFSANKYFASVVNKEGDIKFWMAKNFGNRLNKKNPITALTAGLQMPETPKAVFINFEDGKTVSKTYTFYKDDFLTDVKNIYKEKMDPILLKKLPEGEPLILVNLNLNSTSLKTYVEKIGLSELLKGESEKEKINTDDLFASLKGDLMIAILFDQHNTSGSPLGGLSAYIAATVTDEKKLEALVEKVKTAAAAKRKEKEEKSEEDEDEVKPQSPFSDLKPVYRIEKGVFVLSLSEKNINDFMATENSVIRPDIKEFENYPTLSVIDVKAIFSMLVKTISKGQAAEEMKAVFEFAEGFDKLYSYSGKFENNGIVTTTELRFADPHENSLKQLFKMIGNLAETAMKLAAKKDEIKKGYN